MRVEQVESPEVKARRIKALQDFATERGYSLKEIWQLADAVQLCMNMLPTPPGWDVTRFFKGVFALGAKMISAMDEDGCFDDLKRK